MEWDVTQKYLRISRKTNQAVLISVYVVLIIKASVYNTNTKWPTYERFSFLAYIVQTFIELCLYFSLCNMPISSTNFSFKHLNASGDYMCHVMQYSKVMHFARKEHLQISYNSQNKDGLFPRNGAG